MELWFRGDRLILFCLITESTSWCIFNRSLDIWLQWSVCTLILLLFIEFAIILENVHYKSIWVMLLINYV
jgi:hypothetical protein